MELIQCAECKRDVDPLTHPAPWSLAHRDYAQHRAATMKAPMSMPTIIARSAGPTLTPKQQRARDEVLAARRAPHRTLTATEGWAALADQSTTTPAPRARITDRVKRAVAAVDTLAEFETRSDPSRYDHSRDYVWPVA